MKITNLRIVEYQGRLSRKDALLEGRFSRPVDIYPEYRLASHKWSHDAIKVTEGEYLVKLKFLWIDTDEMVSGLAGPVPDDQAYLIKKLIAPKVIGQNPLGSEKIWDQLYRIFIHGRKGVVMEAISIVDCAIWDLKGKLLGQPVCSLLGGPVRDEVDVYVSTLGYPVEPELAHHTTKFFTQQGIKAIKWFPRFGPADGVAGLEKNISLIKAVRQAAGDDVDIMIDCWMSWNIEYAGKFFDRLGDIPLRWIEEPVLPDHIHVLKEFKRKYQVPIGIGEHENTRWGIKNLIDVGVADILQPDIYWVGGLSETLKIVNLASAYCLPVVPHVMSVPETLHLMASQPVVNMPALEFLYQFQEVFQLFYKQKYFPENGVIRLPECVGLGVDIDNNIVDAYQEINYSEL